MPRNKSEDKCYTLEQVAERTRFSLPKARRILNELMEQGFVRQTSAGKYYFYAPQQK